MNQKVDAPNFLIKLQSQKKQFNGKIASAEKARHRIEGELEEMATEYERTHAAAVITEKRRRNFDKIVGD